MSDSPQDRVNRHIDRKAEEMAKLTDAELFSAAADLDIPEKPWYVLEELVRRLKESRQSYDEIAHAVAALSDGSDHLPGIHDGPEKMELETVFGNHRAKGWIA